MTQIINCLSIYIPVQIRLKLTLPRFKEPKSRNRIYVLMIKNHLYAHILYF